MTRLYYLDCSIEKATPAILSQLGVSLGSESEFQQNGHPKTIGLSQCDLIEHKSKVPVTYVVKTGELIIDIRDQADCWIRGHLLSDESITIPANLFYRASVPETYLDSKNVIVYEHHTDTNISTKIEYRYTNAADRIALNTYHTYKELVCQLCYQFFEAGWVTGTGGSISIRYGNRIYMTPSGVQKERIKPDDLYVLDTEGNILATPEQKPGCRLPKLSDCSPLFLHAFKQRNAGEIM